MKKLITFTVCFIMSLVFLFPGILTFGIRNIPNDIQPSNDKTRPIYRDHIVSQDFISTKNNLTALGMTIKNPNLKNKKDVILNLYDGEKNLVRTAKYNGASIEDGSFIKLLFDPIANSKDKNFNFTLLSPGAGDGDLLEVFYTLTKPAWIGQSKYDNKTVEERVSFVTFHKPDSRFALIKEIYSSWINRFFADRIFATFYISILFSLFGYLLQYQKAPSS